MTDAAKPEIERPGGSRAEGKLEELSLSVLAEGDSLQGRLVMQGDGQLLGSFQGEVECAGELLIGRTAQVAADIRTQDIVISGFVRGNVIAAGRLRITATGRLEGDARVGSLIVLEGGVHQGVIRVHPEGVPAEEQPVAALPPAAPLPTPPRLAASVERVKRLWGELF